MKVKKGGVKLNPDQCADHTPILFPVSNVIFARWRNHGCSKELLERARGDIW